MEYPRLERVATGENALKLPQWRLRLSQKLHDLP
jgi:hypothetical protein